MKVNQSLMPKDLMADASIPARIILPPVNFTPSQIRWASQHDWFCFATPQAVYAWSIWCGKDAPEPTMAKLTTFQALRDWAGY